MKQNKTKKIVFFLVTLVALVALGCATQVESRDKVDLGYKNHLAYLPIFVGLEKGFFSEEGLEVNTVVFDSTNQMITAVAAGQIDAAIGGANLEAVLSLEEKNSGLLNVFTTIQITDDSRMSCVLVEDESSLATVESLQGKTIGTLPGSFAPLWIKSTFEAEGVDFSTVTVQGIDPKLQLAALEAGTVDGLFTAEPMCSFGINSGVARVIYDEPLKNLVATFAASVISVETIQENPHVASKIVRATDRAIEYIKNNPRESIEILAKHTGYKKDLLKGLEVPSYATSTEVSSRELNDVGRMLYDEGALTKPVEVDELVYVKESN